jgi:hypothetical protein
VFVKAGGIKLQRRASKEVLVALAAIRRAAQVGTLHAIGGVAMGADNVQCFGHGR